jgi:hypothetical protein
MPAHSRRAFREIAAIAESCGFAFDSKTSRGHLRWRNEHGRLVVVAASGDPRAIKNIRRDFRRLRAARPPRQSQSVDGQCFT